MEHITGVRLGFSHDINDYVIIISYKLNGLEVNTYLGNKLASPITYSVTLVKYQLIKKKFPEENIIKSYVDMARQDIIEGRIYGKAFQRPEESDDEQVVS